MDFLEIMIIKIIIIYNYTGKNKSLFCAAVLLCSVIALLKAMQLTDWLRLCTVEMQGGGGEELTVKPLLESEAWMDGWRWQRREEGSVVEACGNNGSYRSIFETELQNLGNFLK